MIPFAIFSLVAFSLACAFYFWRRSQGFYQLLIDGANRFDELRQKVGRLEHTANNAERKIQEARIAEETARKTLATNIANAQRGKTEFEQKQGDTERRVRNIEAQRDHILGEFEQATVKLEAVQKASAELREQISILTEERNTLKKQLGGYDPTLVVRLQNDLTETRNKLREKERALTQAQARPSVDPRELETTKRRAAHNELLFSSMKGLRDMVDERNRNYEDALVKLSTWVLTKSSVARPEDVVLTEGNVGPLVGEALQRIGAHLVDSTPSEEMAAERAAMGDGVGTKGVDRDGSSALPQ